MSQQERRRAVATDKAPGAIGPYSQALVEGRLVFCSGQIPLDPATGQLVAGTFRDRAERVFANLEAVLAAAGSSFDRVIKVTVYLTDLAQFPVLNEVYAKIFTEPYPARAVVGVATLPKATDIEIELVATTD